MSWTICLCNNSSYLTACTAIEHIRKAVHMLWLLAAIELGEMVDQAEKEA